MRRSVWIAGTFVVAAASFALGAETRKSLTDTYAAIADTILASKRAEAGVVRAILDGHQRMAQESFEAGRWDDAAAHMALWANEGDNSVGGIRKRLLEGGHHHNAEGEAKGIYEEGYVVVTKAAKTSALEAVRALQAATDAAGRQAAWTSFQAAAEPFGK